METYLCIASRREDREYTSQPIPDDVVRRILDAGRLAGSSRNSQKWEFVVVSDREALAQTVFAPENVRGAAMAVAIAGEAFPFDVGRAAENMLLVAWSEGIGSCPNGIRDADAAEAIVGAPVRMILSFGYPVRPRNVASRTAEEWSGRANRRSFDEVVRFV